MRTMYPKPIVTQKQVVMEFEPDSPEYDEHCTCPYCGEKTTGKWSWNEITSWLVAKSYCQHFCGFAAGERGKPTAFYRGLG